MSAKPSGSRSSQEPTYINDIKVYHRGLPGPFRIKSDSLNVHLKAEVDSNGIVSKIDLRNCDGEPLRDGMFADLRGSLYFTGDARLAQIVIVVMGVACEAMGVPERVSVMVSAESGS